MRISIFVVSISTILLYGSECWVGNPDAILGELDKVNWLFAWKLAHNRRILNGTYDKEKAYKIANLINIPLLSLTRKLRWLRKLFHTDSDVLSDDRIHWTR